MRCSTHSGLFLVNRSFAVAFAWILLAFGLPHRLVAQDGDVINPEVAPAEVTSDDEDDFSKATELGIRFTPKMATAMSKKFVEQMKPRYDLDEKQVEEITEVMQRQFMKFAHKNGKVGRDMVEMMFATMLENDGRFPKEEAQQFAKMAKEFVPKLRDFFTEGSAEIGKKMSMKQRLQFTGDVGIAAAGLVVFENRMKRWEEGKIGDFANPFFDPADKDPSKAEPEPDDPKEHKDHRQARKQVETWINWTVNKDERWESYIEKAVKYYGFDDKQKTSADAILKDCKERAKSIKSKEWLDAVKENRIAQSLSYKAGDYSQGPWMTALEESFEKLMKPMNDLDAEFKRRINDLPDSTQRANARETVRKALAEKGLKQLPS